MQLNITNFTQVWEYTYNLGHTTNAQGIASYDTDIIVILTDIKSLATQIKYLHFILTVRIISQKVAGVPTKIKAFILQMGRKTKAKLMDKARM